MPTEKKESHKSKIEKEKNKLSETLESIKKNENVESIVSYAKGHVQDTVAYVLLVFGIVWLFFNPFYAGILVGIVSGHYYSAEILDLFSNFNQLVEDQGIAKNLILAGTILSFFILAPGVFVGGAIIVGIKFLIKTQN